MKGINKGKNGGNKIENKHTIEWINESVGSLQKLVKKKIGKPLARLIKKKREI